MFYPPEEQRNKLFPMQLLPKEQLCIIFIVHWWIQDFPERGRQPRRATPTYYLGNFSQKLHENEEILSEGVPRDPTRSANVVARNLNLTTKIQELPGP